MKSLSYMTIPALLTFILLSGWQSAQASPSHAAEQKNVSNLVIDTLVHTEEAIALLRINPDSAKAKVNHVLSLIKEIDAHYEHYMVASLEKQGSTVTATDYLHYYPRVDLHLLSNKQELPTLNYKLETDIVYQGSDNTLATQNGLYFDYTFAKASLVTARDAIDADHPLEAMANLRRVFEAIYVNPDFNVSPDY